MVHAFIESLIDIFHSCKTKPFFLGTLLHLKIVELFSLAAQVQHVHLLAWSLCRLSAAVLVCQRLRSFLLPIPSSCKNLIDLRKHLDTHSKEPAYRCEFESCNFSARSLCSIKLHYKKVHEVRWSHRAWGCLILDFQKSIEA